MSETTAYEALESVRALRELHAAIGTRLDGVLADARTEEEAAQAALMLLRVLAMSVEVSADGHPRAPHFTRMDTPGRKVGGDNPDAEYDSLRLNGAHRYRIRGNAGTVAHLSMTFTAAAGERRSTFDYRNQSSLGLDGNGDFTLVLAPTEPSEAGTWIKTPEGPYSILIRQFIGDRTQESLATYTVEVLDDAEQLALVPHRDGEIAAGIRGATGAFRFMTSLNRIVHPELFDTPHQFVITNSDALGADVSGMDNLYMLATYDLGEDEALVVDLQPLDAVYWNIAVMTRFHETLNHRSRPTSRTNAEVTPESDGSIRLVLTHGRAVHPNWLDTAGHRYGVLILRWVGPRDAVVDPPSARVVAAGELDAVLGAGR